MAHINSESGNRTLWCIGCETTWNFARLECPFCLEYDQGKLGYLKLASTEKFRLYTCDTCHRYLKTVIDNSIVHSHETRFEAEYLATSTLDTTASFENYIHDFVGFTAFDLQDNAAARRYVAKAKKQVQ
jgi:formate dehydrogenase maturation protein FdhE